MAIVISQDKPRIELSDEVYFLSPGRNYLNNLLRTLIATAGCQKFLDAGAGELRNYRLFPYDYTGIGIERSELSYGISIRSELIKQTRAPKIYELDLNKSFSFLGPFCFCACTATLMYLDDPIRSLKEATKSLRSGGSLFFDFPDPSVGLSIAESLEEDFSNIYVVFYGSTSLPQTPERVLIDVLGKTEPKTPGALTIDSKETRLLTELTRTEMESDAGQANNSHVAVYAECRKAEFIADTPPMNFRLENGVNVLSEGHP